MGAERTCKGNEQTKPKKKKVGNKLRMFIS